MEMNDVIDFFHHNHLLFNLKKFFSFSVSPLQSRKQKLLSLFFFPFWKTSESWCNYLRRNTSAFPEKVKNFLKQQLLSSFSH